jgi:SAM-dependent methyltransferase
MADRDRVTARELARRHVADGDPLGWFEVLYDSAHGDSANIPSAIKVGCGLGDDAEELSRRGFDTVAFDISPSAIAWCLQRFPASSVSYAEADLLQPPDPWVGRFDLVVESYTLQVLPLHLRQDAMARVASLVAPRGTLLVVARGREPFENEGEMPWPLTRRELETLTGAGLVELSFEDFVDEEDPPVRRFRSTYRRE